MVLGHNSLVSILLSLSLLFLRAEKKTQVPKFPLHYQEI
jgi:hypothetical protein